MTFIPRTRLSLPFQISFSEALALLSGVEPWASQSNFPVQVEQTSEAYVLHVEVPGVPRDQVTIGIKGHQLSVQLAKPLEGHRPRVYGQRIFDLPKEVAREHIHANTRDGILTITLPKIKPEPEFERHIDVEEGQVQPAAEAPAA